MERVTPTFRVQLLLISGGEWIWEDLIMLELLEYTALNVRHVYGYYVYTVRYLFKT